MPLHKAVILEKQLLKIFFEHLFVNGANARVQNFPVGADVKSHRVADEFILVGDRVVYVESARESDLVFFNKLEHIRAGVAGI